MPRFEGLELLQPLCAFPQRRLHLGPSEAAVVQALCRQRERYQQSQGTTPLCLSLEALAQQTGLPTANLQRTISRVNAKLIAQSLLITCLYTSVLGPLGYGLFRLSEIVTSV